MSTAHAGTWEQIQKTAASSQEKTVKRKLGDCLKFDCFSGKGLLSSGNIGIWLLCWEYRFWVQRSRLR